MRVAVCQDTTDEMVAVNVALVAPDGTTTEAGTLTALLLLARLTDNPALGAPALKLTEQLSLPAPVIEEVEQLRPDSEVAIPAWPRNVIDPPAFLFDDFAVALMLSCAVTFVGEEGLKPTCTTMLPPGVSVAGKVLEVMLNALDELVS